MSTEMDPIDLSDYVINDSMDETSFGAMGVVPDVQPVLEPDIGKHFPSMEVLTLSIIKLVVDQFYESLEQEGHKLIGINYNRFTTDKNGKLAIKVFNSKTNKIYTISLYENKGRLSLLQSIKKWVV